MTSPGRRANLIDKLDYPSTGGQRRLLHPNDPGRVPAQDRRDDDSTRSDQTNAYAGSFFERVAEQIQERDREMMRRAVARYGGFACAVFCW